MGTDYGTANALSHDGLGFALNGALSGRPLRFPQAVSYRDDSGPFRIDATLGRWQIAEGGEGNRIEITIATGTLRDIDKGNFPLAGAVLTLLVDGQMIPAAVVNPDPLSELQQEGLLDAVSTYLNAPAIHYQIATVSFASQVPAALGSIAWVAMAPVVFLAFNAQSQRTLYEAALPIAGRDIWLSRVLSLLTLIWVPLSIAIALGFPPLPIVEAGAVYTLLVLAVNCIRIREIEVPRWLRTAGFRVAILAFLAGPYIAKRVKLARWFQYLQTAARYPER